MHGFGERARVSRGRGMQRIVVSHTRVERRRMDGRERRIVAPGCRTTASIARRALWERWRRSCDLSEIDRGPGVLLGGATGCAVRCRGHHGADCAQQPARDSHTYFVRVRGLNTGGTGPPSNELVVTVAHSGCTNAPNAPSGLNSTVSSGTVTLAWNAPAGGCGPTSYVLQAGSATGLSDLATFNTGSHATNYVARGVSARTYYLRVLAANAYGQSGRSNEIIVTVRSATAPRFSQLGDLIVRLDDGSSIGQPLPVDGARVGDRLKVIAVVNIYQAGLAQSLTITDVIN